MQGGLTRVTLERETYSASHCSSANHCSSSNATADLSEPVSVDPRDSRLDS